MTSSTAEAIGRTRTVLVLQVEPPHAFITSLTARIRQTWGPELLYVCGRARPDADLFHHLVDVVLSIVYRVADLMHLPGQRPAFELSVANCAAAAILERGIDIRDFSADAAVFLALLAALFQLRVPQNVIVTGHVRSPEGELGPVAHLGLKLDAVRRTRGLRRFIYPTGQGDLSLEALGPSITAGAGTALVQASDKLSIRTATDVYELVRIVFDQPANIVRASLKAGFFRQADPVEDDGSAAAAIAKYLTADLEGRFWQALEARLLEGDVRAVRELTTLRARFAAQYDVYPSGWGRRLLSLMTSMPSTLLTIKSPFPLLSPRSYFALARCATADDQEDLKCLTQAVNGSFERSSTDTATGAERQQVKSATQAILDEVSERTLVAKIALPIDTARARFVLSHNTTSSIAEFDETVTSFYLAMLRYLGTDPGPVNTHYAAEALALLARAFAKDGGAAVARAEAAAGAAGGLKFVLDQLAAQLTQELEVAHIRQVAESTINSRPWQERRMIIDALCEEMMGPGLIDLPDSTRERLTQHAAEFLVEYVRLRDGLRIRLRSY